MNRSLRFTLLLAFIALAIPFSASYGQWQKLGIFSSKFFNEVFFVDNDHGWITGQDGLVLRTVDAGANWQTSFLPGASQSFNRDICFLSAQLGFVAGEDGIWKTFDGGVTWTNITPSIASSGTLGAIWFINANVGVCGFGPCNGNDVTFCRTTDGGQTWRLVSYTESLDVAVGGITYMNGIFYAAGGFGKIWKSVDNGANWTLTNSGSNGWQEDLISANGILFTASASGGSCDALSNGRIMRSSDAGQTWSNGPSSFFPTVMWGVTMYSPTQGWVCGNGGRTYKTTDNGLSWKEFDCGIDPSARLDDIWFSDATHGWAVGDGIYQFTNSVLAVSPSVTICTGETTHLQASGQGDYTWSPAEGLSCTDCPDPVASPTKTTTYRVSLSGRPGCQGTDTIRVTVLPPPKITTSGQTTICAGDSTPLAATGGESYLWSPSDGLSCVNCANPVASPRVTTTYTVLVMSGNTCTGKGSVTVTVNRVDATIGPDRTLCIGDSARLSVSGGIAYRWEPSPDITCDSCAAPMVHPTTTTTYRVNVTGANGCHVIDSVKVTVVPLPVASAGPPVTICDGTSTVLGASGGTSYRWTPPDGLSCTDCPNPVAGPVQTTTYHVVVLNANGCRSEDSVTVTVKPVTLQVLALDSGTFVVDTTKLTHTTCREVVMQNLGEVPIVLASPSLERNLEFSIPPSQLPITIPPGGNARLTICYSPSADERQFDTLTLPADCPRRIPVAAQGIRFGVSDGTVCRGVAVRVSGDPPPGVFLKLNAPRPNPVSASVLNIDFSIADPAHASLLLYDGRGEIVARLLDADLLRGTHRLLWDASALPSGIYYYTLRAGERSASESLILVR
ncbi:MAG: hypothetical protein JWQ98_48 [Chlorobi bacterium]|nr:hypothetical protein [Chlorobiota bacterium]